MTIEEIFSTLLAHMRQGLHFHNSLMCVFNFLNLKGYAKCHEYHFYEESLTLCHLQSFLINSYNKLFYLEEDKNNNIIPVSWYKYMKQSIDVNSKRNAIRDMIQKWVAWEEEAKQLLEKTYRELYELGEVNAAIFIGSMVRETSTELVGAQELFISLESIGYDLSVVTEEQSNLYREYSKKIKQLYKEENK